MGCILHFQGNRERRRRRGERRHGGGRDQAKLASLQMPRERLKFPVYMCVVISCEYVYMCVVLPVRSDFLWGQINAQFGYNCEQKS